MQGWVSGRQDAPNTAGNRGSYRCFERLCCVVRFACRRNSLEAYGSIHSEERRARRGRRWEAIGSFNRAAYDGDRSQRTDEGSVEAGRIRLQVPQAHAPTTPASRPSNEMRPGAGSTQGCAARASLCSEPRRFGRVRTTAVVSGRTEGLRMIGDAGQHE